MAKFEFENMKRPADVGSSLNSGHIVDESPGQMVALPNRPRWQFRIQSLLWLTLVIALALACFIQSRQLRDAQLALARNSWASRDTLIPSGKFRLMVNRIADDSDLKVFVIRFEANGRHFVSAGGQSSTTSPMTDDDVTHWAEITLVGNYDSTDRHYSLLTRVRSGVGYAGGKSVHTLRPQDKPEDFWKITVEPGLYDLNQSVEIYRENGKPVMLTVK
jgi:hypothetical protein